MSASMSVDNQSKRRPLKAWEFHWSKVSPEERDRALSAVEKAHGAPVKPTYPAPPRTPPSQVREKPSPSSRTSAVHQAMHPSKNGERIQPSFMVPASEPAVVPSLRVPPVSLEKTIETRQQGGVISFPGESLRIDLRPEIERLTQLSAAEAAARRAAERREREALLLKEQAERLARETSEKAKSAEAALREVRERSSDASATVERLRANLMEETARRDDAERRLREAEARLQSASNNQFRQSDRPFHADEPDASVVFGRPTPGSEASLRRPVVERMGVPGSKGHPGREVQVIRRVKLSEPAAPHVTGRLTLASFGGDQPSVHTDQTDADRQSEEDRRRRAEEIREKVSKSPLVRSVSALIMLVQASERASGEKRDELFSKASDTFATVRKLMTSLENRLLGSMLSAEAETDASS